MAPVSGWGGDPRPHYDPRRGETWFTDASGGSVVGARDTWPSQVRRMVRSRRLAEIVLIGQPVLGYTPGEDALIGGQRSVVNSTVPAPTLTTAGAAAGGAGTANVRYRRMRNSGGGVKQRFFRDWGPVPIHHIVDPAGGHAGWGVVAQDLIAPTFDAGNAWFFFGIGSFNTATDETSKVGAWWHTDNSGLKWKSGVYDGTGTPSTTQHETTHSSLSFSATGAGTPYRLSIFIDAITKGIYFYADGVLKDTFVPSSALAQFTNCPHLYMYGITEAAADASLYTFGGFNPRLLTLVPRD